jgi:flagellar hook-associated protein 2
MSNSLRITGLATGIDTDTLVKQLMQVEQIKIDKVLQEKQLIQWQQELYRDIIGEINSFKSTYFDVLKTDSYMLSTNTYSSFDVVSSAAKYANASASASAVAGTYVLSNVVTATKATQSGNSIKVRQAENQVSFPVDFSNDTLIVNIDGTNYKVTLNAGSYALDANGLIKEINDALANAEKLNPNGSEAETEDISDRLKAELSFDGKFIKFSVDSGSGSDVGNINITGNAVKTLGFSSTNFSVSPTASSKMSSIFSGTVKFTVNGKDFEYDFSGADKNKTIQNILDDISSKAGVKASFSELSGRFTISSINTGSNEQLNIGWDNGDSNSGDSNSAVFLDKLFNIKADNSIEDLAGSNKYYFRTAGTDASVTIKDPNGNVNTVIKSNNTFTIDGVTYSLLQNTTEETKEIELTITSNPDKTFKKIVEFIDRYNSLIDKINSKLTEKKQYSYKPLTDEQKKEMSEKEIELWEEKAKQGLLKGDTYLEGMLSKMRTAFFDPVKNLFSDSLYDSDNIGISLSDIGLSTSSDISQRGKIIIDEAKLKEAIQNHGDKVAELFTKKSTTKPSYSPDMSAADRNARYQESGIFQRINDILQDYVRTTRDSNGKKGLLLEKAGIKGDFSELNNILSEQLKAKERLIEELEKKFAKKQEKYYAQFAQLEKAMNQLNCQSSWLAMQLGTYGG